MLLIKTACKRLSTIETDLNIQLKGEKKQKFRPTTIKRVLHAGAP